MWPGAMNSSLALSTSSSGSCASFTNEVKSPMLHSRKVARSICIDMEGNQDSSIPLSCSQCSREVWIIRDISTQGKQLDQQSKTTNRRKEEPAEPCSRESGGASKWPPPPEGGGVAEVPIHDATVTPKTALQQGVTERQIVFTAHQEPSWAVDWRNHSGGHPAPCKCASYVQSFAFMKRAGP